MAVTGRYAFTQPETLVALIAVVIAGIAFTVDSSSINEVLIRFVHITSFSLSVGMSFWVTFVAGLTMYKILPRHQFSAVQMVLFPKYFSYSLLFCSLSLSSFYFLLNQQLTTKRTLYQMSGLALTFCFTLVNLIVAPSMNALMVERNAMEAKEGIGKGVADHNQAIKKFKEENSEYAAIYSRFVRLHGVSALSNLISLVGIAIHLCVLSLHTSIELR